MSSSKPQKAVEHQVLHKSNTRLCPRQYLSPCFGVGLARLQSVTVTKSKVPGVLDGQMIRTLHLIPVWTRPRLTSVPSEVVRLAEVWQHENPLMEPKQPHCTVFIQHNCEIGGEICHEIHLTDGERRSNTCVCLLLTDERNPAGRRSESLQPLMSQLLFWSVESKELNNRCMF